MTALTQAQTRSTLLVADGSAPRNAALFAGSVLAEWELSRLEEDAGRGVAELAAWAVAHGPGALVTVRVVWDGPLLFAEVCDRGGAIPFRPAWLEADADAVARLEGACLEWDADRTAQGRCLWASFKTGHPDPADMRGAQ